MKVNKGFASVTHLSRPLGELSLKPQKSPMSQAPEHLGGNSVKYSLANRNCNVTPEVIGPQQLPQLPMFILYTTNISLNSDYCNSNSEHCLIRIRFRKSV